jgi:hypothetical protein
MASPSETARDELLKASCAAVAASVAIRPEAIPTLQHTKEAWSSCHQMKSRARPQSSLIFCREATADSDVTRAGGLGGKPRRKRRKRAWHCQQTDHARAQTRRQRADLRELRRRDIGSEVVKGKVHLLAALHCVPDAAVRENGKWPPDGQTHHQADAEACTRRHHLSRDSCARAPQRGGRGRRRAGQAAAAAAAAARAAATRSSCTRHRATRARCTGAHAAPQRAPSPIHAACV